MVDVDAFVQRLEGELRLVARSGEERVAPVLDLRVAGEEQAVGTIQQRDPDADAITTMRIDSLAELPEKIAKFNAEGR